MGLRINLDRCGKEKNFLHPPGFEPRTNPSGSVVARTLSMNVPRLRVRKFCSVFKKFHLYDVKGIHSGTYKQRILPTDPTVNFLGSIPGRDFSEL